MRQTLWRMFVFGGFVWKRWICLFVRGFRMSSLFEGRKATPLKRFLTYPSKAQAWLQYVTCKCALLPIHYSLSP